MIICTFPLQFYLKKYGTFLVFFKYLIIPTKNQTFLIFFQV